MVPEFACHERDVNIHDVGVAAPAADHADGSGVEVIQRAHLDQGISEQSSGARLAGTPSPTLRDHTGRYHAIQAVFDSAS